MARTTEEILAQMVDKKNENTILSTALTSNSKGSFWKSLFSVFAFSASSIENNIELLKQEVETIMLSKQVHNKEWWRNSCLIFQYGYDVEILPNGNLGYLVEDLDAQIIKRAAIIVEESTGQITIKVAAEEDGKSTALTDAQMAVFFSYINDIQPAGIIPQILSVRADYLRVNVDVYINSQVIDPATGELLRDSAIKPVEEAINNYITSFQDESFGGVFYANKLLAAIIGAEGVENATFTTLSKQAANEANYTDVLQLQGKQFRTYSGYADLENDTALTINYISDDN